MAVVCMIVYWVGCVCRMQNFVTQHWKRVNVAVKTSHFQLLFSAHFFPESLLLQTKNPRVVVCLPRTWFHANNTQRKAKKRVEQRKNIRPGKRILLHEIYSQHNPRINNNSSSRSRLYLYSVWELERDWVKRECGDINIDTVTKNPRECGNRTEKEKHINDLNEHHQEIIK